MLSDRKNVNAINYLPKATIDDSTRKYSNHSPEYNKKVSLSELEILPNPNNGKFNISFKNEHEGEMQLSLYNLNMQLMYESTSFIPAGIYHNKIDFPEKLGTGIYFLEVKTDGQHFNKKIVVNR